MTTEIEDFESQVLQADGPVLVKFWAEWCGPCKAMEPVYEELDDEYEQVAFTSLNIDRNPMIPPQYGVRGIPALVLFHEGNVVGLVTGSKSKSEVAGFLDQYLTVMS